MTKTTHQQNNQKTDALNKNRGTSGNNLTNAQVNGNRGKQLNPNQKTITPTPALSRAK